MHFYLSITNDGKNITDTNFWESEMALKGYLYISTNGGEMRLLVPQSQISIIPDMVLGAKHAVFSILPEGKFENGKMALEFMVEDGSETPWACHLSHHQLDRLPLPEDAGKKWTASVWSLKNGKPFREFELPAYVQIVPRLPWLKRLE